MIRFHLPINVALVLLLMCAASAQELTIAPSDIEITSKIEDTLWTHAFKLTNGGAKPVSIVEFKGGCGCISHELKVSSLAPGASTEMTIAFEFRDSVGPQKRKIALITKAEGATETVRNEILIHGDIPTPLTFNTKAAIWLYGEEPTPKTISVDVQKGVDIQDLKVETPDANPFITVKSAPAADGRGLVITITPTSTDINVVSPTEKSTTDVAYVVSYAFPSGKRRFEKIFALIAKRPQVVQVPPAR